MITVRNICLLSLGASFYMISELYDIPSINIPFSLFMVGVFLGIVRSPFNYLLYFFVVVSEIPDFYMSIQRTLATMDSEIYFMLLVVQRWLVNSPQTSTGKSVGAFEYGVLFVGGCFLVWLIRDSFINFFKNRRLWLVLVSYPIFMLSITTFIEYIYILGKIGSFKNVVNIEQLVPLLRDFIMTQRYCVGILSITIAPIYAYFVAKELKIYKRLGIGN